MLRAEILKKLPDFTLDLSFEAHDEILVLFGPSGAGKTMTLRELVTASITVSSCTAAVSLSSRRVRAPVVPGPSSAICARSHSSSATRPSWPSRPAWWSSSAASRS